MRRSSLAGSSASKSVAGVDRRFRRHKLSGARGPRPAPGQGNSAVLGSARRERHRLGEAVSNMHPGMFWWHARRGAACGENAGRHSAAFGAGGGAGGDDFGSGSLGVRRPLRFLAYKLDLDESQATALAAILSELKT